MSLNNNPVVLLEALTEVQGVLVELGKQHEDGRLLLLASTLSPIGRHLSAEAAAMQFGLYPTYGCPVNYRQRP